MTLVEVLAGLVVLGTLLASVAIARGRFMRQWADADRRLRAAEAADGLLANWLAGPAVRVPLRAEGPMDGAPGFVWRTSTMMDPNAAKLGAVLVRFEVFDHRPPAEGGSPRADYVPVVTVDLLVHKPDRPAAARPS